VDVMNLKQFVGRMAEMGGPMDRFLSEHGTLADGHALPKPYRRGESGFCFQNAALLAMMDDSLTYVEGYGAVEDLGSIPVHHAWCVTRDGTVIDTTWDDGICQYLGVTIPTDLLRSELLRIKHYGVLLVKGRFNERFAKRWRNVRKRDGLSAARPVS
jgi:hypothetical protein